MGTPSTAAALLILPLLQILVEVEARERKRILDLISTVSNPEWVSLIFEQVYASSGSKLSQGFMGTN